MYKILFDSLLESLSHACNIRVIKCESKSQLITALHCVWEINLIAAKARVTACTVSHLCFSLLYMCKVQKTFICQSAMFHGHRGPLPQAVNQTEQSKPNAKLNNTHTESKKNIYHQQIIIPPKNT